MFSSVYFAGDIKLKVVFLPAYMDVEVVIATKFACEPDAYWEEYMDAMTRDINKKVNLNMYRGKSGKFVTLIITEGSR